MGIWIRSQDKEILAECNFLKLKYTSVNNRFYIYADSKGEKVYLGGYSTREKALKVLDMIQEYIESNNSHHNSQWDSTPHLVYNVFRMPQDDVLEK